MSHPPTNPGKEIFSILVITKYGASLNTADHHMVKGSRRIQSCLSGHNNIFLSQLSALLSDNFGQRP
ncbi:MAG: hypothetical protein FD151_1953 [bacterium]|nr:MAG: hypothetical protein FD151_1953 [bacterium]